MHASEQIGRVRSVTVMSFRIECLEAPSAALQTTSNDVEALFSSQQGKSPHTVYSIAKHILHDPERTFTSYL